MPQERYRPEMTRFGLAPTHAVTAYDEYGQPREVHIAGESPSRSTWTSARSSPS